MRTDGMVRRVKMFSMNPPTKIGQTVDLKVSCVAEAAGTATCALRGWYE